MSLRAENEIDDSSELKTYYLEAKSRLTKRDEAVEAARTAFWDCKANLESIQTKYSALLTLREESSEPSEPTLEELSLKENMRYLENMMNMSFKVFQLEEEQRNVEFSIFQDREKRYLDSLSVHTVVKTTSLGEASQFSIEDNVQKTEIQSELQQQVQRMIVRAKNRKKTVKIGSTTKRPRVYDRQTKRHLTSRLAFQEYDLELIHEALQDIRDRITGAFELSEKATSGDFGMYGTFGNQRISYPFRNNGSIVPVYHKYASVFDPSWKFTLSEEGDVLHVSREIIVLNDPQKPGDVSNTKMDRQDAFIFGFGCVILWNFKDEDQEMEFENSLVNFGRRPNIDEIVEYTRETMTYQYGEVSKIEYDEVSLLTDEYGERLAISFAFAQSCLLRMFEWRINSVIERNESIPLKLMQDGGIDMSGKAISRELGRVFYERTMINLGQYMDDPEYFWNEQEWEPLYDSAKNYFDNQYRMQRLDKKLLQLKEIFDLLSAEADRLHGVHLEWIVIWLIVVEVCVDLVWDVFIKDILGFFK